MAEVVALRSPPPMSRMNLSRKDSRSSSKKMSTMTTMPALPIGPQTQDSKR